MSTLRPGTRVHLDNRTWDGADRTGVFAPDVAERWFIALKATVPR